MLRESTGLGRTLFCRRHELKVPTLISIEASRSKPGFEIIEKLALAYPEYSYWLITGKVTKQGQTRPKKPKE